MCQAEGVGCKNPAGTTMDSGRLPLEVIQCIFGLKGWPESYQEWEEFPHSLWVCWKHYKALKHHGYTFSYTYRNGKLHARIVASDFD
jgi:hypothetical protein